MNLSDDLRQTIDQTAENLQSEAAIAQRRFLIFEGLITELRYLQQQAPVIDPSQVAAVAQRPDIDDRGLRATYPTPWTDLYLILQLQKCGEEFQAASVMAAAGRCLVLPSPPGPPQH